MSIKNKHNTFADRIMAPKYLHIAINSERSVHNAYRAR